MTARAWARTGSTAFVPSIARMEAGGLSSVIECGQALEHHGQRDDARRLYEQALSHGTASTASEAAQLLRLVARTYLHDANYVATVDCATAALAVADQARNEAARGHAINILAIVEWKQGNMDEAERLYLLARESAHRSGEERLAAMTSSNLGIIANVRGEEREARQYYESSLAHARSAGRADQAIAALCNLGQLDTQSGHLDVANRHLREAHELATVIGDRSILITIELHIAKLRIRQGDLAGARAACDRTRGILEQIGDASEAGEAEYVYGIVARAGGDAVAAERHFLHAEQIGIARQDMILQGEIARELSELYRAQGRNRQTLLRLNHAHRLFAQLRARRELADVDRRTAKLENEFLDVVRKWGESIESKDIYTQGHCVRVADLACALWTTVHAGDDTSLFWFRIGALLHDVGKLMIPAEVLNKPGKLSDEEWAMMRGHPSAGVELLADIEFPWDVRPIVESHHERWDGRGYPHGLAGEEIPLTARVLCVADVYDALTSVRSYKCAFTHDEAMEIMRQDVGKQFDPVLYDAFAEVMRTAVPATTVNRPRLALIA
ncbi:MAG TPA: HD domain-containing phosphohydrolase [Gemmatimonadaceae bacterium]|nr:HD domain-containing phosphohydrolase [Gemmatimonadaceae bacterium]